MTAAVQQAKTGARKAAILLMSIGEEASADLLKQLSESEVTAITKAIAHLETVPADELERVLEEVYSAVQAQSGSARGGAHYARKLLASAFGPEHARRMAEQLPRPGGQSNKSIESLQKVDPQQLSRFLEHEHPQTIALILAHLSTTQAASLLSSLPVARRSEVAVRMASMERISPEVVAQVAAVISDRMKAFGDVRHEPCRGPRAVAEVLNRMDTADSDAILADIQENQGLVDAIRHYMFVFEDLLMLDSKAMKDVVAKVDRKLLMMALKGAADPLRQHFFAGLSQRGAEMLREDMESLGPVKIKEVEAAQQQILAVIREMENEGQLSLKGGGQEQYVV